MSKLPKWLIKKIPKQQNLKKLRELITDNNIHTVCESAHCPNLGECYSHNTMTFMILGNICTRNCNFCAVEKGAPQEIDQDEPEKIAKAAHKLNLNYVVITSVTRDDLPDGGASQFAKAINRLNSEDKKVEVLIPDFKGKIESLGIVVDSKPFVINHNVETVPRLYEKVRPMANYQQSLGVLRTIKELNPKICTKSGFMVGLGETEAEVYAILRELRSVGCDIVTIGQYLAPSPKHIPVQEYIKPETFQQYKTKAQKLGFLHVESGPFARSSYHAERILNATNSR